MKKPDNTAFEQEQYDLAYPDGIENHFWNLSRNNIILRKLKNKKQSKILDIGCGRGITVEYLRNEGFDCYGCDISSGKAISKNISQYLSFKQDAFDLDIDLRKSIDTILLLDVVEHLEDVETFINKLLHSFHNLSYLIITVPARQELWSNYDVFYGHYLRYNNNTLKSQLIKCDLSITKTSYFFKALYLPSLLLMILKKKRSLIINAPKTMFQIIAHKALAMFFFLEEWILPNKLIGTSLLAEIVINNNKEN